MQAVTSENTKTFQECFIEYVGITPKNYLIAALERFFDNYPEWHKFIMQEQEKELEKELEKIHQKFFNLIPDFFYYLELKDNVAVGEVLANILKLKSAYFEVISTNIKQIFNFLEFPDDSIKILRAEIGVNWQNKIINMLTNSHYLHSYKKFKETYNIQHLAPYADLFANADADENINKFQKSITSNYLNILRSSLEFSEKTFKSKTFHQELSGDKEKAVKLIKYLSQASEILETDNSITQNIEIPKAPIIKFRTAPLYELGLLTRMTDYINKNPILKGALIGFAVICITAIILSIIILTHGLGIPALGATFVGIETAIFALPAAAAAGIAFAIPSFGAILGGLIGGIVGLVSDKYTNKATESNNPVIAGSSPHQLLLKKTIKPAQDPETVINHNPLFVTPNPTKEEQELKTALDQLENRINAITPKKAIREVRAFIYTKYNFLLGRLDNLSTTPEIMLNIKTNFLNDIKPQFIPFRIDEEIISIDRKMVYKKNHQPNLHENNIRAFPQDYIQSLSTTSLIKR